MPVTNDGNAAMSTPADAGDPPAPVIDRALLENWALAYLGRYASSAENLRRILRRRVRRRVGADADKMRDAEGLIDALVERYRATSLLDDAAFAIGRARNGLARGRSLRQIAGGLAAKGVEPEERAAAVAALREETADPDLTAACAFARRRRLGPFGKLPTTHDRALAAFARAGFARTIAEAVLACADEAAVAALLADGGCA